MSLEEFLTQVQQHYIEQLLAFIDQRKVGGAQGAAEVKLQLSQDSPLFGRIYCVDYLETTANGPSVIEMMPDRILRFDPITFRKGDAVIVVESLCWDDVQLSFDSGKPDLSRWFDTWFDPDEKNFAQSAAGLTARIHSLGVEDGLITIDGGSAPAQAVIALVDELTAQGARSITIRTSRE